MSLCRIFMKEITIQNCSNWKTSKKSDIIMADDTTGNCGNWGAFITTSGVCSYKERRENFNSGIAPLEHYHTILMDEKYQNHEYLTMNKEYFAVRKDLIELLFETGKKLRQTQSTVYLAISYMDIILNTANNLSYSLPSSSFKVISVVCLNIASKFDSLDMNTPYISELQRASSWFIPYESLLKYEAECLKILNWNLK